MAVRHTANKLQRKQVLVCNICIRVSKEIKGSKGGISSPWDLSAGHNTKVWSKHLAGV